MVEKIIYFTRPQNPSGNVKGNSLEVDSDDGALNVCLDETPGQIAAKTKIRR